MRHTLASIAAVVTLLGCSPAQGACPPRSDMQAARSLLIAVGRSPIVEPPAPVRAISLASFYDLCARKPAAFVCSGGTGYKPSLADVVKVDKTLRATFEYQDDYLRTGKTDLWEEVIACGDCEDYALTLAADLHRAGVAGETMRIMLWSPSAGAAHATLLVQTVDAGEVEIGVGASETPRPYDATRGARFGSIRFDGRRYVAIERGYRRSGLDVEVDETASRR